MAAVRLLLHPALPDIRPGDAARGLVRERRPLLHRGPRCPDAVLVFAPLSDLRRQWPQRRSELLFARGFGAPPLVVCSRGRSSSSGSGSPSSSPRSFPVGAANLVVAVVFVRWDSCRLVIVLRVGAARLLVGTTERARTGLSATDVVQTPIFQPRRRQRRAGMPHRRQRGTGRSHSGDLAPRDRDRHVAGTGCCFAPRRRWRCRREACARIGAGTTQRPAAVRTSAISASRSAPVGTGPGIDPPSSALLKLQPVARRGDHEVEGRRVLRVRTQERVLPPPPDPAQGRAGAAAAALRGAATWAMITRSRGSFCMTEERRK